MAQIQILIVTPETTTLDKAVDSVTVPLIDGEAGIYPGHAPMIGRLGPGELRVRSGKAVERFYVDGGFVQVEGDVVSVLPGCSMPVSEIDVAAAKSDLEVAEKLPASNSELGEIRQQAIAKAQAQIKIAQRV